MGARTVSDILSGGSGAEKYRDFLGKVMTVTGYETVNTKNGESVQFHAVDDDEQEHVIWAPSVVSHQVKELAENDLLPVRLLLMAEESANGREYFTLKQLDDEVPDLARVEPPEDDGGVE